MTQIEKYEYEISKITSNLNANLYKGNDELAMRAKLIQLNNHLANESEKQKAIFDYQW